MKKLLLLIVCAIFTLHVNAQSQNYKSYEENTSILKKLLKSAEKDFKNITGDKLSNSDEGYTSYDSELNFGVGTETIEKKDGTNENYFSHISDFKGAHVLSDAVNDYIKKNVSGDEYVVDEESNEYSDAYTKRVFKKGDEYPFLLVSLTADIYDTKFIVYIFGRSAFK